MVLSSEFPQPGLQAFQGPHVSIVIGMDVGTTFSSVSYAILRPGEVPKIHPVGLFSDQGYADSKIPSIIYYDDQLNPVAIGAACTRDTVIQDAEDQGWTKVEHFKMHLRPSGMKLDTNGLEMKPLPPGKPAEQVMADFLGYLLEETGKYIVDHQSDGPNLWPRVRGRAQFVLTHPNGWTGACQQKMRRAALMAGLVPDIAESYKRITFITEGEATALAYVPSGLGQERLEPGSRFVVLDAGARTLDVASYEVTNANPVELRKIARPDCRFAGSIFVKKAARAIIEDRLRNSRFDDEEILHDAIEHIEQNAMRQFGPDSESVLVRVGDRRANDLKLGIQLGYLKLSREELQGAYEISVREGVAAIRKQMKECHETRMPVWLVGEFSANNWLFHKLQEIFEPEGIRVLRPDTIVTCATTNGALLDLLGHLEGSRVSKTSYGTRCDTDFNPLDAEHQKRSHLAFTISLSERRMLGDAFSCILEKETQVRECKKFSKTYYLETNSVEGLGQYSTEIFSYDGEFPVPGWYSENEDKIHKLCTISADFSKSLKAKRFVTPTGRDYFRAQFEIELQLSPTELRARITWFGADGKRREGPVSVVGSGSGSAPAAAGLQSAVPGREGTLVEHWETERILLILPRSRANSAFLPDLPFLHDRWQMGRKSPMQTILERSIQIMSRFL